LKLATTAAASTAEPSEKVMPSRSVKVNSVAVSLTTQLSASQGRISPLSGSWSVSESTTCRVRSRA
jgi:hypothetical protein